jgi:hypothetical protein
MHAMQVIKLQSEKIGSAKKTAAGSQTQQEAVAGTRQGTYYMVSW